MPYKANTRVSQFNGWFTVNTVNESVRYFNGRKYTVWKRVEHYVHPNNHKKDFSDVTNVVFYTSKKYHTETMRFSQFTFPRA